jgi:hypothetical protein
LKGWQSLDWVEKSMTGSLPMPVVIWKRKAMGMMSMLESGIVVRLCNALCCRVGRVDRTCAV